ncbi:hypothetical protein SLOPH_2500 [Spraguea lophii 42_110]|uniref:Uncharacterized protein n=1 Tax=Spraguea lophii (strain 42_110) TaxID=1358809 RepID=S7XQ90_SPRLO|nr:hypothetical protein SLOPH_2500 [Spraguea lophii 42_110]
MSINNRRLKIIILFIIICLLTSICLYGTVNFIRNRNIVNSENDKNEKHGKIINGKKDEKHNKIIKNKKYKESSNDEKHNKINIDKKDKNIKYNEYFDIEDIINYDTSILSRFPKNIKIKDDNKYVDALILNGYYCDSIKDNSLSIGDLFESEKLHDVYNNEMYTFYFDDSSDEYILDGEKKLFLHNSHGIIRDGVYALYVYNYRVYICNDGKSGIRTNLHVYGTKENEKRVVEIEKETINPIEMFSVNKIYAIEKSVKGMKMENNSFLAFVCKYYNKKENICKSKKLNIFVVNTAYNLLYIDDISNIPDYIKSGIKKLYAKKVSDGARGIYFGLYFKDDGNDNVYVPFCSAIINTG